MEGCCRIRLGKAWARLKGEGADNDDVGSRTASSAAASMVNGTRLSQGSGAAAGSDEGAEERAEEWAEGLAKAKPLRHAS